MVSKHALDKIEFVRNVGQGHGGKPGIIYTLENNEIVSYDCGLGFDDYPNGFKTEYYYYNDDKDTSVSLNEYNKNHALVVTDMSNNQFGIAFNNQIVVPCSYKKVYENNDYIWLGNDDNWELYNSQGNKVLNFVCNSVNINKDIASSHYNDFICSDGLNLMDYSEECIPFLPTENIIAVYTSDGCTYFDVNGTQLTSYGDFEEIRPVHNNLAWVKKDGKWGVIQFGDSNTYSLPEISLNSNLAAEINSNNSDNNSEVNVHKYIYNELIPKYGLSELAYFNNTGVQFEALDYPSEIQGILSVPYYKKDSFAIVRVEPRSVVLDYYKMQDSSFKFIDNIKLYEFDSTHFVSNFELYMYNDEKIIYSYDHINTPGYSRYGTEFGVIEIESFGLTQSLVIKGNRFPLTGLVIDINDREWSCKETIEDGLDYDAIKTEIEKELGNLGIEYYNDIEIGWISDSMYGVYINNNWLKVVSLNYEQSVSCDYFFDGSVLRNKFFMQEAGLDYDSIIGDSNSATNNIDNSNNNSMQNNGANNENNNFNYGTVTTDGDELFVRSSPEIINSPGKGNKIDCYPNGTRLEINMDNSTDEWYYVTGVGLSGNTVSGYVSKSFVALD